MQKPSILVIDDEPDNFDVIETLLSHQNYRFHYTASGVEAIAALDILQPDLILLDVMMPGMDGIEVCQQIKTMPQWETVPIIMVTALTDKKDIARCLNAGADDFISKPVSLLELTARVRSMLRIRQLHTHLEDQVTQRTAQLMATNAQLEQQIQERLLAEAKLQHSESRFRALIENASDLILLVDPQRLVHYASPSVEQNLGYLPTDLISQRLTTWVHRQDQAQTVHLLANAMVDPGTAYGANLRWCHRNGNECVFETKVQHFTDATGFSGIVVNAREITERLQVEALEHALKREKELSELKFQFFSMTSHEFRTPLSIILMAANVLEQSSSHDADAKTFRNIERIRSNVNHLNQMLADILDMARLEAQQMEFKPEWVGLKALCDRILDSLSTIHNGQPRIQYTYRGPTTSVSLDPQLLSSILTNLLTNALKYSDPDQPVQFQVAVTAEQVEFQISDQGIGIPEANQAHVFNPFQRGDNVKNINGSGLGLAIVKKCVDLHSGQITCESIENQGTTFFVKLPALHPVPLPLTHP